MEPTYLYVALLDILGYRHHLESDRKSGTLVFQEKLAAALKVFESVNDAVFRVQAISDTIIITCVDHEHFPEFLLLLREVFLAFLRQQLFIRGGVAYSRHFQNNHLTYSHAVARAYEIETTLAIYPRIAVDENIMKMYELGEGLPSIKSQNLLSLENGVFFIDVLTKENWQEVFDLSAQIYLESSKASTEDQTIFSKYLRFERYLLSSGHVQPGAEGFCEKIQST